MLSENIQSLLTVSDIISLHLKHLCHLKHQSHAITKGKTFVKVFKHLVWAKPRGIFVLQKERTKGTLTVTVLSIVWTVSHMCVMRFAWVCGMLLKINTHRHTLISHHQKMTSLFMTCWSWTCNHSWVPGQTMLGLWPFNKRNPDYEIPKMVEINHISKYRQKIYKLNLYQTGWRWDSISWSLFFGTSPYNSQNLSQ